MKHARRTGRFGTIGAMLVGVGLCAVTCPAHAQVPSAPAASPPSASTTTPSTPAWTHMNTPAPAADIVAVGNVFWICGEEEMIASSGDGGATWTVHHRAPGGKTLLHIEFVNDRVAHAAGRGGIVLGTTDGGQTWKAHHVGDDVIAFSFGDERNGIAVIGRETEENRRFEPGVASWETMMTAPVRLTHDGGEHWEDITALSSEELKSYTDVLSVAALDALHYAMIRRQSGIEDVYVVTHDGGKTWKVVHQREDATNREFARLILVHGGEYWAFGTEMVHRDDHGGSTVPLAMRSKDGEHWVHGVAGKKDFGGCNLHGCYMWDGTVVSLFGEKEQYWAFPQDGSLSKVWAVVGDRVCTLDAWLECGPARVTDEPQPTGSRYSKPISDYRTYLQFAEDCTDCGVWLVPLDPGGNWKGRVMVSFTVRTDGTVDDLSEDGAPEGPLGALIEEQVKHWTFKFPAAETKRKVAIDVSCVNEPAVQSIDGCTLTPAKAGT